MRSSTISIDGLVAHLRSAGVPIVFGLPTERICLESCFVDGSGLPYGLVYRGTIYVRLDTCSLSVLCHEYTHLWVAGYRRLHPVEWRSWVAGCVALPTYSLLAACTGWSDRDRLADECLAILVGEAVSGSCVADALACRWVSRVLADCLAGVNPVGVVDDLPRCFFIGIKGARRLRWYDPEPYRMLSRARLMKRKNWDSYFIKEETGWEQGVDFYWRYETNAYRIKELSAYRRALDGPVLLKDLVDLPVVFKAYPQLGYYKVIVVDSVSKGHVAQTGKDFIQLERKLFSGYLDCWDDKDKCGRENLAYYIFHELQHAIQTIEGFSKGASLFVMGRLQSPAMMRIHQIDPAIFSLGLTVVSSNTPESLAKGGLKDLRESVERYKSHCSNPNSYLNHLALSHMDSILERCDEEGYEALTRLLHAVLEQYQTPGWDDFRTGMYYRYAGEVEARNAAYRTLGIRESMLAETTEDFDREDQIIGFLCSISNLKQAEWAKLSGKKSFI